MSIQAKDKEHKATIINGHVKSSTLSKHSMKTKYHICVEDIKVLSRVDHFSIRRSQEGNGDHKIKQLFQ